jgi:hypothetical protein
MTIENFSPKIEKKELIINPNESIKEQLLAFVPDKNPDFTALKYLKDPEAIKKYWQERVIDYKNSNPDDSMPEEILRSNLAHHAGYGEDYEKGWDLFKQVLSKEITETTTAAKKESDQTFK